MTKEVFRQEMLACLEAQHDRYPEMEQEDAVKFVFQGMLGAGHLLSSRERTAAYIAAETEQLQADPREPLFETLSPDWCRLNLRRAMAENLSPDLIAALVHSSSRLSVSGRSSSRSRPFTPSSSPTGLKPSRS